MLLMMHVSNTLRNRFEKTHFHFSSVFFLLLLISFEKKKALPKLMGGVVGQCLIVIPSYFDFVRVRNFFKEFESQEDITYAAISEYSEIPEVTRARGDFFHSRVQFLIVTERFHFYRRFFFFSFLLFSHNPFSFSLQIQNPRN